jgi:hypothetical protein
MHKYVISSRIRIISSDNHIAFVVVDLLFPFTRCTPEVTRIPGVACDYGHLDQDKSPSHIPCPVRTDQAHFRFLFSASSDIEICDEQLLHLAVIPKNPLKG